MSQFEYFVLVVLLLFVLLDPVIVNGDTISWVFLHFVNYFLTVTYLFDEPFTNNNKGITRKLSFSIIILQALKILVSMLQFSVEYEYFNSIVS